MEWIINLVVNSFIGKALQPIISGLLTMQKQKLDAVGSHEARTAELAGKELDLQGRERDLISKEKIAIIGKWYEPEKIMCYTVAGYFMQLVIYDKMLGDWTMHRTDPLTGWAAVAAGMVLTYMFGKRTVNEAIKLWKS